MISPQQFWGNVRGHTISLTGNFLDDEQNAILVYILEIKKGKELKYAEIKSLSSKIKSYMKITL